MASTIDARSTGTATVRCGLRGGEDQRGAARARARASARGGASAGGAARPTGCSAGAANAAAAARRAALLVARTASASSGSASSASSTSGSAKLMACVAGRVPSVAVELVGRARRARPRSRPRRRAASSRDRARRRRRVAARRSPSMLRDHVAGLAGRARSAGPPGTTRLDLRAVPARRRRRGGLDAEVGALDLLAALPAAGTTWRDGVGRHREADADVAAARRPSRSASSRRSRAPASSSSGPPELPGLIGASVWMTSSIEKPFGAWISRPMPETMPSVAVRSSPKGLPIAIARSPTCTVRESAKLSGFTPLGDRRPGRCSATARSLDGSRAEHARRRSSGSSSPKRTVTRWLSPTTCALVTIVPSPSIRKPVPDPLPVAHGDDGGAGRGVDRARLGLALLRLDRRVRDGGERRRRRRRRRRSACPPRRRRRAGRAWRARRARSPPCATGRASAQAGEGAARRRGRPRRDGGRRPLQRRRGPAPPPRASRRTRDDEEFSCSPIAAGLIRELLSLLLRFLNAAHFVTFRSPNCYARVLSGHALPGNVRHRGARAWSGFGGVARDGSRAAARGCRSSGSWRWPGWSAWLCGNAARVGARAAVVGGDSRSAARSAVPESLRRGMKVDGRPGGAVRVSLRVPLLLRRWRGPVSVAATSRLGDGG